MTKIAENIQEIVSRIQECERLYQRADGTVRLLAVSKRHPVEKIIQAHAAGIDEFGENYYQEAMDKIDALLDLELVWHFIGPIQANKTRGIAENFQWVQSVDREKIARRLSEQRGADRPELNVCVQVNQSAEATKSGVSLDAALSLCELVDSLPNLCLRGLMAIPAPQKEFAAQRASFNELAKVYAQL